MRHIKHLSIAMTIAGILAIFATVLFDLSPTVALIGLMLAVAGIVKVLVVALWHGAFGVGMPLHVHDATRDAAIEEGRR